MMQKISNILYGIAILFLFSRCAGTRAMTELVINNETSASLPVTLAITDAGAAKTITEKQYTLQPGLQQYSLGKLQKGNYLVTIKTGNGQIAASQNLSLDTDRWIIVGYSEGDSSFMMRRYGYLDSTTQKNSNGLYQVLDLYTESRKPPYLLTP